MKLKIVVPGHHVGVFNIYFANLALREFTWNRGD
jgi:hypothetical protein